MEHIESKTITLRQCIDWMNSGLPFSFKCCTYDKKRPKKSGKWLHSGEAMSLHALDDTEKSDENVEEKGESPSLNQGIAIKKINPNHRPNFTRNIRLCINSKPIGNPIKIHLDLLVRFNGQKVILP